MRWHDFLHKQNTTSSNDIHWRLRDPSNNTKTHEDCGLLDGKLATASGCIEPVPLTFPETTGSLEELMLKVLMNQRELIYNPHLTDAYGGWGSEHRYYFSGLWRNSIRIILEIHSPTLPEAATLNPKP